MIVSFFKSCEDNIPQTCEMSFEDLTEVLATGSLVAQKREAKEAVMCVVPADFQPAKRASDNAIRYAFTGDVDGDRPGDPGFDGMVSLLEALGLAFIIHTTTKSTIHCNRYRVILPFTEPLSRQTYEEVWDSINQMLGDVFDAKTFDAARLSIVPCAWHGAPDGYDLVQWVESEAHHGFAAKPDGWSIDAASITLAYPPRPRGHAVLNAPTYDVSAVLAAAPPVSDYDYHELIDLDRSPMVRPEAVTDYLTAPSGGRFFKFLCSVASVALLKGLPMDESVIFALGMAMNDRGRDRKRRSIREARRAIAFVAASGNKSPKLNLNSKLALYSRAKKYAK